LSELRTVNLPADLCERAEKKFGGSFDSLEQMLEYMLTDLLRDDAAQADQQEQSVLEQRLRDLGYL
jgi:hypothetical protein